MLYKSLAIDAVSDHLSISVFKNNNLIKLFKANKKNSQSEELMPNIKKIFQEFEWKLSDLDFLSLVVGPGSLMRIRIALSAGFGLRFGGDIPIMPVNLFEIYEFLCDENHVLAKDGIFVVKKTMDKYYVRRYIEQGYSFKVLGSDQILNSIIEKQEHYCGDQIAYEDLHSMVTNKDSDILKKNFYVLDIPDNISRIAGYVGLRKFLSKIIEPVEPLYIEVPVFRMLD